MSPVHTGDGIPLWDIMAPDCQYSRRHIVNKVLAILLLALSLPALAALDVAGVKFDDTAKVGADDTVINGAGMRKRAFFKVYAIGIYLPQKAATTAEVLAAKGAKRIAIVTLRDLTAEQFVDALIEALKNNHD